jgi:hypothetical protein
MKKIIFLILTLSVGILFADNEIQISEIQTHIDQYEGQQVTIEGIVTIGAGVLHASQFKAYVEDNSGYGIEIFDYSLTAQYQTDFVQGAKINITGTVENYVGSNGDETTEIKDFTYTVISTENDVPFENKTISQLLSYSTNEIAQIEGKRVSFEGVLSEDPYYAGGGYNINVTNDNGQSVTARVWDTTQIDVSSFTQGLPLKVYGVIGSYHQNIQIIPGYDSDLVILLTEPQIKSVIFTPNNPFIDQEITVRANVIDYDGTLESVKLFYKVQGDDEFTSVDMESGTYYQGTIPSMDHFTDNTNNPDDFIFYIEATDNDGNVTTSNNYLVEVVPYSPVITELQRTNTPNLNERLLIRSKITDIDGTVKSAELHYTLDFSLNSYSVPMTKETDSDYYNGSIPAQSSGTTVYVYVYAVDDSGLVSVKSLDSGDRLSYTYPVLSQKALLKINPKPFDPYNGETIKIKFNSKEGDKVILRIYNSEGLLVYTPKNELIHYNVSAADPYASFYEWDGRNKTGSLLPMGLYIAYLETSDIQTGDKKTAKAPIVIGTSLK